MPILQYGSNRYSITIPGELIRVLKLKKGQLMLVNYEKKGKMMKIIFTKHGVNK